MLSYLLIGCDDDGVHTEMYCQANTIYEALDEFECHPFQHQKAAEELLAEEGMSKGDFIFYKKVIEAETIDLKDVDRYKEIDDCVVARVKAKTCAFYNLGCDPNYSYRDAGNVVDGDSQSMYKIYVIDENGTLTGIYPLPASNIEGNITEVIE